MIFDAQRHAGFPVMPLPELSLPAQPRKLFQPNPWSAVSLHLQQGGYAESADERLYSAVVIVIRQIEHSKVVAPVRISQRQMPASSSAKARYQASGAQ